MHWLAVVLMSSMLSIGCSHRVMAPCNREDVVKSRDTHGQTIYIITKPCWDRMLGDLDACVQAQK